MRIDWLEDVLAIIETGSMNEAARARLLTQPAFSRRVKALEDLLGIGIVDRKRKPARPTDAVREHEDRIREIAGGLRTLVADLKRQGNRGGERILIASQHSITTSLAPSIVTSLTKRRRTRISLQSANRDKCHALLLSRQVDLTLTYQMPDERPYASADFTEEILVGEDTLIPVFNAAGARRFSSKRFRGEWPVITYPADVFLGKVFATRILPKILSPVEIWPVAETALTLAALQLSKAAVGVAWVPSSLAAEDIALGNLADLRDALPTVETNLVATRLSQAQSELQRYVWEILAAGIPPRQNRRVRQTR